MIINNNSYRLLMTIMLLYIYIGSSLCHGIAHDIPGIPRAVEHTVFSQILSWSFRRSWEVFLDQNNL